MLTAPINQLLNKKVDFPWMVWNILLILAFGILLIVRVDIPDVVFAVLILFMNAFMIGFARRSPYMLTMAIIIAYYNYSVCMANYISVITTTYFTRYAGTGIGKRGLYILFLFTMMLYFVFFLLRNIEKKPRQYSLLVNNRYNPVFVAVLCILLAVIWVFGFTRPSEVGQRGTPSTYFEYSIILMILGFYYSGKNRLLQGILITIGFAYAGLNFIYGGRATGVQVLICLFFCTVIDRVPKRWIVVGAVALFSLMAIIGSMRASISFSGDALSNVFDNLAQTKFANDTAYSAYLTSMTFLDYMGFCGTGTRLLYFLYYLLSIIGGKFIPNSNLPQITRQYYMHYGGGLIPYYFFFYLGIAGLVVICLYMLWLFSKIIKNTTQDTGKDIWRCIAIYVTSTVLRWYVYSPAQIIRGVLLLTIVFYILQAIDDYICRKQAVV